ncbi:MAG: protoporphyrinogen oxidase, partial [Nitrospinaceae bacterium]
AQGNNSNPSQYTLFMTLKEGLGEMVDRLIEKSPRITFRTGARLNKLSRQDDKWKLDLDGDETLEADGVILASPANISACLLEPSAKKIADLLNRIKYVSTAAVTFAYKKEGFSHSLDGFGFVVPRAENRKIMACTWTSSKFPHRVPEGHVMLRCFVGGALQEELAEQDEASLEEMVKNELREMMGISETPVFARVFKNEKANVQYQVGHGSLIDQVNGELASMPGMFLSGSAYTGIGIPDCILNGARAAESALQYLTNP